MVQEQTRHSYPSRPPPSPTAMTNRNSQLDPATVSAMFPDAAAALATQRARLSQIPGTNTGTKSNRNSAIFEMRPPSLTPTISTSKDHNPPASPWRREENNSQNSNASEGRPKSGHEAMGNWQAPPPSAGLRSPRNPLGGSQNLQTTTISHNNGGNGNVEMPELSPFGPSWASMVNTPVAPMFNTDVNSAQANADMVNNATAMKLAAMSTVNNRFMIDADVKKFRRSKPDLNGTAASPGFPPGMTGQLQSPTVIPSISQNVIMFNERGQPVQVSAVQAAQLAQLQQQNGGAGFGGAVRSPRNVSPGFALQSAGSGSFSLGDLTSPQHNGFLTAYQPSPLLGNPSISLNQFGMGSEGYISDHSDPRGRSPRGRRGSSKPPEDPTDPVLLQDISAWLRSLRLHKYTDNLKDLKWQELVQLDDAALEARGVNALGARRKMLKVCAPFVYFKMFFIELYANRQFVTRYLSKFVKPRVMLMHRLDLYLLCYPHFVLGSTYTSSQHDRWKLVNVSTLCSRIYHFGACIRSTGF